MKWDGWRGNSNGEINNITIDKATMLIKNVFKCSRFGVNVHLFVGSDGENCFHSHQSLNFRLILWGGYIEELENGRKKVWLPLMFGFVPHNYSHRVCKVIGKKCCTLWIKGRVVKHKVMLTGTGWNKNEGRE